MSIPLPCNKWDWAAVAAVIVALVWSDVQYQWGRLRRWWRGAW